MAVGSVLATAPHDLDLIPGVGQVISSFYAISPLVSDGKSASSISPSNISPRSTSQL